jgi:uncharacterized protein (DUF433 family)
VREGLGGAATDGIPTEHATVAYHHAMAFDRITAAPDTLDGKPCIRGLRISVETVVRLVAAGWAFQEILDEYPDLQREDITQALEYAAAATNVHHYQLREPA